MFIVQVHVHVKREYIEDFRKATEENARLSVNEPGIARFDVLQRADDPSRFILTEVYRTDSDPAKHKMTGHYNTWRSEVEKMMAEPREGIKFHNIFPDDSGWG